jgi:hypothetical protein
VASVVPGREGLLVMIRLGVAAALLVLTLGCVDSTPPQLQLGGEAGAGGAGWEPAPVGGSPAAAVDAGTEDAADDAAEMPDGMLFGTGVGSDASSDTGPSDDPCVLALAWEDGFSFWADELPLQPEDYVTLGGTLYQYLGTESQGHMLPDCAPDAPASWCVEQGWIWETIGTC